MLPWCPFGGWEYSRGEEFSAATSSVADEIKNEYATNNGGGNGISMTKAKLGQKYPWVWTERPDSGGVRRRLWRRVYLDHRSAQAGKVE